MVLIERSQNVFPRVTDIPSAECIKDTVERFLPYQDIKSAAYIDAIIHLAETLLGIRLKNVKKYRYSSQSPLHAPKRSV